jgi:halogenation protein CepH
LVKPSRSEYDVIVIGGGPAGTTAATLMHMQGLRVLLAERETYPRFHIGESLLPATWTQWKKLGVVDAIEKSGAVHKMGTRFSLFNRAVYKYGLALDAPEFFPDCTDNKLWAFQVVRAEYDQILLNHSRNVGVEVHQPASVLKVNFEGERATGVVLKTTEGDTYSLDCKVVVDASGRDSFIARKLDLRHPDPKLNKIAYFAHFKGAYREHEYRIPFWAFAFQGGWFWYISLKDDITSIGVVLDTDHAKLRAGRNLWEFFYANVKNAPQLEEWMANAKPITEDLHVISSLSYYSDRFVGDGWLLAGDAAMFVDPIFSSGVQIGMKGGDYAAQTIAKAFEVGDFSWNTLAEYETKLRVPMRVIFPMIYRWYEMLRTPDSAFDMFEQSYRHRNLQYRMNATLGGAYEVVGDKFSLARPMPPKVMEEATVPTSVASAN